MKNIIRLSISEISDHGINFNDAYFCKEGLKNVLSTNCPRSVYISKSPFMGSMEIKVRGRQFISKKGQHMACSDHPSCIMNMLERKYAFHERSVPENFRFYVKINN